MEYPKNAVSAENAAKIIGINPITMRSMLREGVVKGIKIKKCWYVDLDDLRDKLSRNELYHSPEVIINGERALGLKHFAARRCIPCPRKLVEKGYLSAQKVNGNYYVTESEMQRYDKRFEEYGGKKIIPPKDAAERLKIPVEKLQKYVDENRLRPIEVERKRFYLVEDVEKLKERLKAGKRFLKIPKDGKRRIKTPRGQYKY